MKEKIKKILPFILTLILFAIPTLFVFYLLKEYREMKMWRDVSGLSEFLGNHVRPLAYASLIVVILSLIGNFLKSIFGWILTIHFFYYAFVIGVSVTTEFLDYQFLTILLLYCLMIVFMNSKTILKYYKIENKRMVTFNLIAIVIAMTVVLSFSNMILN